jgi:hypothetical protein
MNKDDRKILEVSKPVEDEDEKEDEDDEGNEKHLPLSPAQLPMARFGTF